MKFSLDSPKTLHVKFPGKVPDVFYCMEWREGWRLYFFRILRENEKFGSIKFNICEPGDYFILSGKISKIEPIKFLKTFTTLPPHQRQRMKPFHFVINKDRESMAGTPARNFTGTGKIEIGQDFLQWPLAIQTFIALHEIGHFFYKDEKYCDLYAAKIFIEELGYNPSTALYSLTRILRPSPGSDERVKTMLEDLMSKDLKIANT